VQLQLQVEIIHARVVEVSTEAPPAVVAAVENDTFVVSDWVTTDSGVVDRTSFEEAIHNI